MNKLIPVLVAGVMSLTAIPTTAKAFNDSEMQINIMLSEELAKAENEIRRLNTENAELKEKLRNLFNEEQNYIVHSNSDIEFIFDVNKDGVVDASDASFILTYYAKTSVGYTYTTYNQYYYSIYDMPKGQATPIG